MAYNQLDGNRSHEAAKHYDADGFNTSAADRILVHTWPCSHTGSSEHDNGRYQVHEGICSSGKQGQRARGDGSIELDDKQTEVDHE